VRQLLITIATRVRTFISLPTGVARMPFGTFTPLTVLGCIPWVIAFVLLGDAVGHNWRQWKDHLSYIDYAVVAIAIGVFIAWPTSRAPRRPRPRQHGGHVTTVV
jgi:membrane protein DedA with SNARE-associated domain